MVRGLIKNYPKKYLAARGKHRDGYIPKGVQAMQGDGVEGRRNAPLIRGRTDQPDAQDLNENSVGPTGMWTGERAGKR